MIWIVWGSAACGFFLGLVFAGLLASGRAFQPFTQETNAPSD